MENCSSLSFSLNPEQGHTYMHTHTYTYVHAWVDAGVSEYKHGRRCCLIALPYHSSSLFLLTPHRFSSSLLSVKADA